LDPCAGPETSASIPANLEDAHESATLIQRGPDWNFYEFAGTRFRVHKFQAREERQLEATMERMAENGDFEVAE